MSEEKIQDLVSENLKVRVVLNETSSKDGQSGAAGSADDRPGIDDRLDGARSAAAARRVEAFRQDALKVERKEYTYHYGRIFGASVVILGLLGVLVYVAYSAIQGAEKTQPFVATEAETSSISAIDVEVGAVMPQLLDENEAADEAKLIIETTGTAEASSNIEAADSTVTDVTEVTEKAPIATAMVDAKPTVVQEKAVMPTEVESNVEAEAAKPVVALPKKPTNVVVKVEQVESAPKVQEVTSDAADAVNEADDVVGVGDVVQVQVFSDDVSDVQMSGQIGARRPVGDLPVEVKLGEPAFQTVYIFTTLNNRVGDRVVYQWKRNGRLQAEVPVRVRGQKWQTYSSKNINGQMVGDWSVEMVDQTGNVLLRGEFKAVP